MDFKSQEHILFYGDVKTNEKGVSLFKIKDILEDLKNGLTRTTKDKKYDVRKGTIAEKYNLDAHSLKMLFSTPQLKGKKTIIKKELGFLLLDDSEILNVEMEKTTTENTLQLEELETILN